MTSPLPIGVVLPTLNCRERLPAHLIALAHWTDLVEEIVVVDSFSDDGTLDHLRADLRHPRLRFVSHPRGLYQSWNHGVSLIRSRYVYISTVGDTISREGLIHLAAGAEALRCDVMVSPPRLMTAEGAAARERWPIHDITAGWPLSQTRLLSRHEVFAHAVLSAAGRGLNSILGSSASNLYRTATLQRLPFPADCGTAGDTVWGVQNSLHVRLAASSAACSTFLKHAKSYHSNTDEFNERLSEQVFQQARESFRRELAAHPDLTRTSETALVLELIKQLDEFRREKRRIDELRRLWIPWLLNPLAWRVRARRNRHRRRLDEIQRRITNGVLADAVWPEEPAAADQ